MRNFLILSGFIASQAMGVPSALAQTNSPPVAPSDFQILPDCQPYAVDLLANAYDPDGDELEVSITVGWTSYGTWQWTGPSTIEYTPHTNDGTDVIYYTVQDSHGASVNTQIALRNQNWCLTTLQAK